MRKQPRNAARGAEPRYLRPEGNRRVRRQRRTRAFLRVGIWCLLWLAGAGLAAFGFTQAWRLMKDRNRFPLHHVIVESSMPRVSTEVEESLAPLIGKNLFRVDLAEADRIARSHAWVRWARVQRRLPSTLYLKVGLRKVGALARIGDEIRMLSEEGSDLGPFTPGLGGAEFPVMTGLESVDAEEVDARLALGLDSLRRLRDERPALFTEISEIDLSRRDRLAATFRDLWPPVWLSPADPSLNLDHLPAVRRRLDSSVLDVRYIDLRFRDRIAVMPLGGMEVRRGA